jgi:hypothetical protein
MYEKEFTSLSTEQKDILRKIIAGASNERDVSKIGDGQILAFLAKWLPLLLQFAPLFMTKEEADRKIGDGTLLTAFFAALSNPQFMQTITALIAMIQGMFPAKTA